MTTIWKVTNDRPHMPLAAETQYQENNQEDQKKEAKEMTPTLHNADCLPVMRAMDDNSVNLIVTDPPYYKVKDEPWDRQWDTADGFLAWVGKLCQEWQRILVPNGSLYVFASPQMAWGVEGVVRERFNVLNSITWNKDNNGARRHSAQVVENELARSYFPDNEKIIFAEHFNSDNIAKGEAGYVRKCDELRGFVFEPLRAYLASERDRAGFTTRQVAEYYQKKTGSRTVTGMAGHWFSDVQWTLPTEENYQWLRDLFNKTGQYEYLRREYEDLRREYEDLRREYEDLRRPFNATSQHPYTDVWDFETVGSYRGKHPCEKPLDMMAHIVRISSRPGDVVFDPFMGTGNTGIACARLGRDFIGIDASAKYFNRAQRRIMAAYKQWDAVSDNGEPEAPPLTDLPMWKG